MRAFFKAICSFQIASLGPTPITTYGGIGIEIPRNRSGICPEEPYSGRCSDDSLSSSDKTPPPVEFRKFFSTAFWKPHLITDANGIASFEVDVPDPSASWNIVVHAITRDMKHGETNFVLHGK